MLANINILLVEDNFEQARLTQHILRRNRLCGEIFIVRDGQEALDFLERRDRFTDAGSCPRPHLVLLDLNIPKIDGKQVLRHIKSDERLKDIPVIVVSSSDSEEEVTEVYAIGADGYVSKSDTFERLQQAISSLPASA